jgi:hypothetical protein
VAAKRRKNMSTAESVAADCESKESEMHIRRSSVLRFEDEEAERLVRHVSYVLGDARMVDGRPAGK